MYRSWIQLFVFLGGFVVPSVLRVNGLEVYTSKELEVANGTNVKLKCTFSSKYPVLLRTVSVSWNFRPLHPGPEESVFFYQETPYPPTVGRFKGHAVWTGDILKNDASITLHEVPPTFNGTYICQVRNMPDVHGKNGEVILKVVNRVALSDIGILAIVVGVAIGVVLLLLGIFMAVKVHRKGLSETDIERREKDWKDPTVCKPEEAVHLKVVEKELEIESSDEASEASSGDGEEEDGEEDDDDDDDDDGGDDDDE